MKRPDPLVRSMEHPFQPPDEPTLGDLYEVSLAAQTQVSFLKISVNHVAMNCGGTVDADFLWGMLRFLEHLETRMQYLLSATDQPRANIVYE